MRTSTSLFVANIVIGPILLKLQMSIRATYNWRNTYWKWCSCTVQNCRSTTWEIPEYFMKCNQTIRHILHGDILSIETHICNVRRVLNIRRAPNCIQKRPARYLVVRVCKAQTSIISANAHHHHNATPPSPPPRMFTNWAPALAHQTQTLNSRNWHPMTYANWDTAFARLVRSPPAAFISTYYTISQHHSHHSGAHQRRFDATSRCAAS